MFLTLVLLSNLTFAQEVELDPVADIEPAPLTVPVYPGTRINFQNELGTSLADQIKLDYQAYLVPEGQFDQLLAGRENLTVARNALVECQETSRGALLEARAYYTDAQTQFQTDEILVDELVGTITKTELALVQEQQTTHRLRAQRNVAVALSSGLAVSMITTAAIVLGTP